MPLFEKRELEFLGTDVDATEMAVGRVALPGVYEIQETGKGMTSKYMAEKAQEQGQTTDDLYDGQRNSDTGDEYGPGTLLVGGEVVTDADTGQWIVVSEDTFADPEQTYQEGAQYRIVPHPEQENAGAVEDSDGNLVHAESDPDRPISLTEDGYRVVEASDDGGDGTDDGSDDGGDGGSGGDSGPVFGPGGSPTGTVPEELLPEGFESIRPPPIELTVRAYCSEDTWQDLDALRDERDPFGVAIGEFELDRMGVVDLSRSLTGEQYAVNDVTIKLKRHEEVTVQLPRAPGEQQDTGEDGQQGQPDVTNRKVKGWIDTNNDGIADRTEKDIPQYQEIVVPEGESMTLPEGGPVGDGQYWGNNLIDVTADGASVQITAEGDSWVIKNVGIKGEQTNEGGNSPTILATVPEGGEGVIESVYMANPPATDAGVTAGIAVTPDHAGTLKINRVNVQNKPGGGIDGTGTTIND